MNKVTVCWVLAAALGCTKPNPNYCEENPNKDCTIDAGNRDGDDGAGDADGSLTGEVVVDVLVGGVASSGRVVVFHDAGGEIAAQAMTDSFGTATGTIHSRAMVTVSLDSKTLVTITEVSPGDHIVLKTSKPYDATPYGTVAFSATSEAAGKSYYRNDVGNSNYRTSVNLTSGADRSIDLNAGDRDGGGKINAVSAAYNTSNQVVAYNFKASYTPTQNGTTSVSYTSWLTDIGNFQVLLSGAPSGATGLSISSANERSGFQYIPQYASSSVSSGSAGVTGLRYLGGFGDFVQTQTLLSFPSGAKTEFSWTRRATRPAGDYIVTAADMPPRLGSAVLDTTNRTRPSVQWSISGSGGDAIVAVVKWGDGSGGEYKWYSYAPPDTTQLTFPTVPVALAAQAPGPTSIFGTLELTYHDLEPLAGYDAFRVSLPVDINEPEAMPAGFVKWVRSKTSN